MKKILKSRKSAFTLVELLIVIMVIAILNGMMMIATGSVTDSAEASKLVNDVRAVKSACLLFYVDEGVWPSDDTIVGPSLDKYTDRPMFHATNGKYNLQIVLGDTDGIERYVVGIQPQTGSIADGVKAKLMAGANKSSASVGDFPGGFAASGGSTAKDPNTVYMYMN
ncbi:MAG: type II secretion system GspH family protein [Synergistaceae bacterium]|jgi:general secretion pathway protein G|nr:type II secretion system GspH family protein [Synergistaceae bacterium]